MKTRLGSVKLDSGLWDDIQVYISTGKIPAANYPAWTTYAFGIGSGVAFPVLAFSVDEYIEFYIQTSHQMKLNSVLDNHIHFTLPNTTNIGDKFKFQLDVIAAGVDETWAVPTGSPYSAEHTIAANDNTKHRLLELAEIPAVNTSVSTIYICRLKRIAASANEYGSDVYILFNDSHYIKDALGSKTEYSK